jgi:Flp pilus assembly protein TadG
MTQLHDRNSQRGAIAILVGLAAVVLLGFAALAIDVGYVMVARNQLQNSADAASMAATRELGRIYSEIDGTHYSKYSLTSSDKSRIAEAANRFAEDNRAAGAAINILGSDLVYGTWSKASATIDPSNSKVDAIQVRSRRDEVQNGALSTLLASVAGIDSFSVSASAASGLASPSKIPAGKAETPFGIARAWFEARDTPCGSDAAILFQPTGTTAGCAGWHTFEESPSNASKLRSIIDGIKDGTFASPAMIAGESLFNFTGGTVSSAFPNLKVLYDSKKGPGGVWRALVPVYDRNDCSNPSGLIKIVGFASVKITKVQTSPQNRVEAVVDCKVIDFGEASVGAPHYGTFVSTPKMVQ